MLFHLNFFFRSNSILSNTMIVSTKSQQNGVEVVNVSVQIAESKPVRVVEVTVVVVDTWITWWLGSMATYKHQKIIIQMLRLKMLRKDATRSKRCSRSG
ncbi:hypothetical protein Hanom_Chr00s143447g01819691 [Helianthus anomalus]|nr:hypothetical protein HanPSC8_Chr17g0794301 [Helianthus annuus]